MTIGKQKSTFGMLYWPGFRVFPSVRTTPMFSEDGHHYLLDSLGYTTDKYTWKAAEQVYGP